MARTNNASALFPLRSVGSYHAQFELKWFDLQDYVASHGGVDVVFIGNSMVNTGIDPVVFANRYEELTGLKLRVFNFGVEGLTIQSTSVLAQMIDARYHPSTIILFTEMRDYIAANAVTVAQQFQGNSWMRYQMGIPSVQGFLIDHLNMLQYLLPYRNWSSPDFLDTFQLSLYRLGNLLPGGYDPEREDGFTGNIPDPTNPEEKIRYQQAADFSLDPQRVRDLLDIIALQQADSRVFVTEIPLYPTYYIYFGSASVREQYLSDITSIVKNAGSAFIPPLDETVIPLSGRADDHHINYNIAPVYSRLLAERFYAACILQDACLPPPSRTASK